MKTIQHIKNMIHEFSDIQDYRILASKNAVKTYAVFYTKGIVAYYSVQL